MEIIGTATVLRHGISRYTGIYPDLVMDYLHLINKTAEEIFPKYLGKRLRQVSSKASRAIATLNQIALMDQARSTTDLERIIVDERLSGIEIFDQLAVADLVRQKTGHLKDPLEVTAGWDAFFMRDPVFEAGIICESRTSAKNRMKEFLADLQQQAAPEIHFLICTHLETMGSLIQEWFGRADAYLNPAESTKLCFLENGKILVNFRGQEILV